MTAAHVIKLGGSLLDLPDLFERFEAWRVRDVGIRGLLVIGGGEAADLVRAFDRRYTLTPERGHELAVEAMRFNALLAMERIRETQLVHDLAGCAAAWQAHRLAVMEPVAWLRRSDELGPPVPRRWSFTSDSIAARAAQQLDRARLTLLKSTLPPAPCDVHTASALGVVDADFPGACAGLNTVELVNLRSEGYARVRLRG